MGQVVDSGIEAAGTDSAFIRSVGYVGFQSASLSGEGGFMIWSGSVLGADSPDEYGTEGTRGGVGLELVAHSESYFRFRTDIGELDDEDNPISELDIRTNKFYVGTNRNVGGGQFISGADANIEISSSKFHY
jgi:hypothetical protein